MIYGSTLIIYKDIIEDILKENDIKVEETLVNCIQYAPNTKYLNRFINHLVELTITGSDTNTIMDHFSTLPTEANDDE